MKKHGRILTIMIATVLLVSTVYAASIEPGSSSDPVVTRSYVDQKIAQLMGNDINSGTSNEQLRAQLKSQQEMIDILVGEINQLKIQTSSTYEVVTVPEGKTIVGKQGTEIIVRSGKGVAVGSQAGGLQDMTVGIDIGNQAAVAPYHLIIVPREDGRGIMATTSLIVMVRGGYIIQ